MNSKNKKQIVFFNERPEVINYKIARMFKSKGDTTILFTISQKDQWDEEFYKGAFDKIICTDFQFRKANLKNPIHTIKKIPAILKFYLTTKKLNPSVVIGTSYTNWTVALGMRIFKKYPFVYLPYDIMALRFPDLKTARKSRPMFEINAEKYCFKKADGILTKGSIKELDFLKDSYIRKIKMTPVRISFLPYCLNELIAPLNKNKL